MNRAAEGMITREYTAVADAVGEETPMGRYDGEDYTDDYQRFCLLEAKLSAAKAVLAERERELLVIKGPCSTDFCRLHHAHSGPCALAGAS